MSDLAINDKGEQKAASEFHDDFILHGIQHASFVCPFCFIGLVAKAIYIDGPQGKSPHFSCFPQKPHINGCDGYPLVEGKSVKGEKKSNKIIIGKEEFLFPEKLVSRSKPSQGKFLNDLSELIKENNPEKVEKRREGVGKEVGSAKYTSSIIRSFASSKKAIISLVYKYAKDEELSSEERKLLLKDTLSQAPIELDGYKTNYQVAFQGTKYFSTYKKIWNGEGVVKIKDGIVYILSGQDTEYKHEDNSYELSFYTSLKIPENIEEQPAYHQTIINRLLNAREKELVVKWFAYGMASIVLDKKSVLLSIDNFDHVFIEKV
ncbi:hypothetical protein WH50_05600 [Pokkaliibacter plantistimulans]|uniref:Uncharacterized protein n=1 Tax=Pokkaliibacter plantistimulans TaxID=1635171 RepID=A0ABX5M3Q8_9GAMM|nr:hypothetical protein [Pokkaliibacter plantistimulans]PXF32203.1 hypothetical protein WH50_05600 [Pokkaliibacter plantistimulans]